MKEVKGSVRGITIQVQTPQDTITRILSDTYLYRIGLYGRQGAGKSTLADSFPGKKGIIDADCGALVYSGDVEYVSILEPHKGNLNAYLEVEEALDYFGKNPAINVIVVDSATAVFGSVMFEILRLGGRVGQQPTIPEYGKLRNGSLDFIGKCFGYKKHVIFIFHEAMEKDELSGRVWCNPLITGKLSHEIGKLFDEFYHLEPSQVSTGVKYQALTKSNQLYSCKSRIESKVPGVIPVQFDYTRPTSSNQPWGLSKLMSDVKADLKKHHPNLSTTKEV